jgi:hypothetical protein
MPSENRFAFFGIMPGGSLSPSRLLPLNSRMVR